MNHIIGIGADILNSTRVENLIKKFNNLFLSKFFTNYEICNFQKIKNHKKQISYLAKRFAAKESFAKACGTGIGRGINFKDIEVQNNNLGKPEILIKNNKIDFLNNLFNCKKFKTHLSLSDEGDLVLSYVIIEQIE